MLHHRSAGVLLPVAALPGPKFCGDFGRGARRFIDQLAEYGFDTWQVLPLHPTERAFGYSPYSAQSAFAMDEAYLSVRDLLDKPARKALRPGKDKATGRIDYASAKTHRARALDFAFERADEAELAAFGAWRAGRPWVEEYATWRVSADEQASIHWPK